MKTKEQIKIEEEKVIVEDKERSLISDLVVRNCEGF